MPEFIFQFTGAQFTFLFLSGASRLPFDLFPARNQGFDVVLVDTAGRMQDNAPLMTALAKLIAVNTPDLVLFVGEALVGNEAVDQLVSLTTYLPTFNQI